MVPSDPKTPQKSYDYSASTDTIHYVLQATFDDANNPSLEYRNKDSTGIIYGIDCTGQHLCLTL